MLVMIIFSFQKENKTFWNSFLAVYSECTEVMFRLICAVKDISLSCVFDYFGQARQTNSCAACASQVFVTLKSFLNYFNCHIWFDLIRGWKENFLILQSPHNPALERLININ